MSNGQTETLNGVASLPTGDAVSWQEATRKARDDCDRQLAALLAERDRIDTQIAQARGARQGLQAALEALEGRLAVQARANTEPAHRHGDVTETILGLVRTRGVCTTSEMAEALYASGRYASATVAKERAAVFASRFVARGMLVRVATATYRLPSATSTWEQPAR